MFWESGRLRLSLELCAKKAGVVAVGYPGIILDKHGREVGGFTFSLELLDEHWIRLDKFEGDGYERGLTTGKLEGGFKIISISISVLVTIIVMVVGVPASVLVLKSISSFKFGRAA